MLVTYFLYRSVTSNLGIAWRLLIYKENMTLYISAVNSHPIIWNVSEFLEELQNVREFLEKISSEL